MPASGLIARWGPLHSITSSGWLFILLNFSDSGENGFLTLGGRNISLLLPVAVGAYRNINGQSGERLGAPAGLSPFLESFGEITLW